MDLHGKTAIITGAAQGFGKAFAEALLEKGSRVCISDVNVKQGQITNGEFQKRFGKDKVLFVKCDVSSEEDFAALFQKAKQAFGKIDIVVNNAGIINERAIRKTIEINLIGTMQGTQLAIQHMSREHGGEGGLVLNIASAAGLKPAFMMPAYSASKHGIVGFTRSWAQNPSNPTNGLRFTCMCPAFADTNFVKITDETSLSKQHSEALLNKLGVLEVSKVVQGFMELVANQSNNGAVISITTQAGVQYVYKDASS